MIALDTSVTVAAFGTWHEGHDRVRRAIGTDSRLPAHVALETYSVLTRLPIPFRADSAVARVFLAEQFSGLPLTLSAEGHRDLLDRASATGVQGGAIYDALVAATVVEAGARLLTRDRRAAAVYELLGVDFDLIL